jgi:hypothetical protein
MAVSLHLEGYVDYVHDSTSHLEKSRRILLFSVDFDDFLCSSELLTIARELEHTKSSGTGQRHGMIQVFGA